MYGFVSLLPGGYVDDHGTLHREVELASLTGRDEELLAQGGRPESASAVTAVLARGVHRLGDISPVTEEIARRLLVADRQYLLLKLRQATFGDRVLASLFCPWPDCGQRVSLDFSIAEVPVQESADRAPIYTMMLSEAAAGEQGRDAADEDRVVSFRLPNGADQEALASLVADNEARALTMLLERCLQRIGPHAPPDSAQVARLSPLARAEIEGQMEQVAPRVELTMETNCPECGRLFVAPFDLQRFFFGELRAGSSLLYREVHYLAYHYHWSEREIMDMPRDKRRTYIEVLADEIEKLNNAA
jgi:hypothetical protein